MDRIGTQLEDGGLTQVNGATPYCAVHGRVPHVPLNLSAAFPDGVGRDVNTKHIHRIREISVQGSVEATMHPYPTRAQHH